MPAVSAGAATVEVLPGQTLSELADAYGTTVATLAAVNGIADPNLIVADTFLVVPTETGPTGTAAGNTGSGNTAAGTGARRLVDAGHAGHVGDDDVGRDDRARLPRRQPLVDRRPVRHDRVDAGRGQRHRRSEPHHRRDATRRAGGVGADTVGGCRAVATTTATTTAAPASTETSGTATGGLPAALVDDPTKVALEPIFTYWAEQFGLPSSLLEAMCWWESGWQSGVTSVTGAQGIGQLEPATVSAMQSQIGTWSLDPYTATANIEMAAAYLHDLMVDTGGTPGTALASYYQGLASVEKIGLLPSTEQYVAGIEAYTTDFS